MSQVQSPLEAKFLDACKSQGLRVVSQYPIGPIHADFAVLKHKLAIECDSEQFHSSDEAQKMDRERDWIYGTNGWYVLRLHGADITRIPEEIASAIRQDLKFESYYFPRTQAAICGDYSREDGWVSGRAKRKWL